MWASSVTLSNMSRLGNILFVHHGDSAASAANDVRDAGFHVIQATRGREALRLARSSTPDLVMVRHALPDLSGIDVCRLIKTDPRTAAASVIILGEKADETERIAGLEAGADDVLAEKVSKHELVVRMRAVLRCVRQLAEAQPPSQRMQIGALVLDGSAHTVQVCGVDVPLTLLEFRLLWLLVASSGSALSRAQLLSDVWGPNVRVEPRTVDQHIKRLRTKLGIERDRLETVRQVGYRFDCDENRPSPK